MRMKQRSLACTALLTFCGVVLFGASPVTFSEEPVTLSVPSGHLSGTLMLPSGPGPFPVALIIAGSGPTDRDGNSNIAGLQSDAYKKLAQGLAARGIATLRYDKRGIGASVTTQSESELRFDDYVDDAVALAKMLQGDKRFSNVSIIGHSEGSLIGMIAAARDPGIRAFVSLEGAGRNLATILDEQFRASGAPPGIVNEAVAIDASLLAGKIVVSPDPQLAAAFRPSVQPYLISEYRYDPAIEIAKLTIPIMIVHGGTDLQVSSVDADRLAAAAPKAKLLLIPGMNHILVDAPADRTQNIATYSDPALPLDPKLVPAIAGFLLAN